MEVEPFIGGRFLENTRCLSLFESLDAGRVGKGGGARCCCPGIGKKKQHTKRQLLVLC